MPASYCSCSYWSALFSPLPVRDSQQIASFVILQKKEGEGEEGRKRGKGKKAMVRRFELADDSSHWRTSVSLQNDEHLATAPMVIVFVEHWSCIALNNITRKWQACHHYIHTHNKELLRTANISMRCVACLFRELILDSCKAQSDAWLSLQAKKRSHVTKYKPDRVLVSPCLSRVAREEPTRFSILPASKHHTW